MTVLSRISPRLWLPIFLALGMGWAVPSAAALTNGNGFKLQDFLGHTWRNESVRFPLSEPQLKKAKAGKALIGPDEQPVLYQLLPGATEKDFRIEFLADLDPFETRVYRFTDSPAKVQTDLQIEETPDLIRLSNALVGISIRKELKNGVGPIESIRLASGQRIGSSSLSSTQEISSYTAEVAADGPVFCEVVCRAGFETQRTWEIHFRVQANEPVILVDETFSLRGRDASPRRPRTAGTAVPTFILSIPASPVSPPLPLVSSESVEDVDPDVSVIIGELDEEVVREDDPQSINFSPNTMFYRSGGGGSGKLATWEIPPGWRDLVFVLEPWLHWAKRERQGTWFGLYNKKGPDLLAIGAREADIWVEPRQNRAKRSPAQLFLGLIGTELKLGFPLRNGRRKWMIASLDKDASLALLKEKNSYQTPLPQKYLIKHSDFPLNKVKDYVCQWPGDDKDEHPRLYVKKKDLAKLRETFQADPSELAYYIKRKDGQYWPRNIADPISYYLGTGNPELGRRLAKSAVGQVQSTVNMYLKQNGHHCTLGIAPHQQRLTLFSAMNLADATLDSEHLTPEQRGRIRTQIAFLGYTLNRDDYWSRKRGFSANPNMSSMVAGMQAVIACMIPSHPMASTWMKNAMKELKSVELDTWSGPNGGWLECPAYAMFSYDHLLAAFLAARNSGFDDYLFHPKMKKVMEWLAKISTPPDSRMSGFRHLPPVGNTNMCSPSGLFGLIAYLWRNKDPEFASYMQWMYRQQGSHPNRIVGFMLSSVIGYWSLLTDQTIPEKAPAWKSELFPSAGVILRTGFPFDRETQMHMIAGGYHEHYDFDSGSITLWGKGRVLANEFGKYGQTPGEDHNMVISPIAQAAALMRIKAFAASESLDYVRGVKQGWTRQIAFVKDSDPLGPNYYVMCDSLSKPAQATWLLWLMSDKVTGRTVAAQEQPPDMDGDIFATLKQEEDVDMDLDVLLTSTTGKPDPGGQSVAMEGREDVDMDIFFTLPRKNIKLRTERRTRRSFSGVHPDGRQGPLDTTQTGLIATLGQGRGFTTVLYPRLKTEKPAVFFSVAEGKGVKVETSAGTDYVFLSPKPISFKEGDIAFEGTVGAIQTRGTRVILSLGAAGSIAANGHSLEADKPAGPSVGEIK